MTKAKWIREDQLPRIVTILQRHKVSVLAKDLGVCSTSISHWLSHRGLSSAKIKRDYRNEYLSNNPRATINELAKAFNCSYNTARVFLNNSR